MSSSSGASLCGTSTASTSISAVRLVSGRLNAPKLAVGDAAEMPWRSEAFHLIIVSTVFTSILDDEVRRAVAGEIVRVLAPGGALLWYDFAFNNPGNSHVRKVTRRELRGLFPGLTGRIQSVGLAPPIARRIAPLSWVLATALEALPVRQNAPSRCWPSRRPKGQRRGGRGNLSSSLGLAERSDLRSRKDPAPRRLCACPFPAPSHRWKDSIAADPSSRNYALPFLHLPVQIRDGGQRHR